MRDCILILWEKGDWFSVKGCLDACKDFLKLWIQVYKDWMDLVEKPLWNDPFWKKQEEINKAILEP